MSTAKLVPGQPKQDLLPLLGAWLWEGHDVGHLIVSDKNKYYFKLLCNKGHLRLMTPQAACRQLQHPKNQGKQQLFECERCSVGDYALWGPEPVTDNMHRSYWEALCWLSLERVLGLPDVQHHMGMVQAPPFNILVGPVLGYVVECKAIAKWGGCVDVFVPSLNLAIQVDGEHHDAPEQQEVDKRFMTAATKQGVHALRLSWKDWKAFYGLIKHMVYDCMNCNPNQSTIARYSPMHPLTVGVYEVLA